MLPSAALIFTTKHIQPMLSALLRLNVPYLRWGSDTSFVLSFSLLKWILVCVLHAEFQWEMPALSTANFPHVVNTAFHFNSWKGFSVHGDGRDPHIQVAHSFSVKRKENAQGCDMPQHNFWATHHSFAILSCATSILFMMMKGEKKCMTSAIILLILDRSENSSSWRFFKVHIWNITCKLITCRLVLLWLTFGLVLKRN